MKTVKKLFNLIKESGVEAYLPAKKTGKCTDVYAVVSREASLPTVTGRGLGVSFTVKIAAPLDRYGDLCEAETKIMSALAETPFKFEGSGGDEVDGENGAYVRTLTFSAFRRAQNR